MKRSRTLNFVDHLHARGRRFQELGCTDAAMNIFARLSSMRSLGNETAEDVHCRLGEMYLERGNYRQARRHLTAALARRPSDAHYHYLLALAYDQDEDADPQDACRHYRASLRIDPDQPDCLSNFGLLILSFGESSEGLSALRRAAELTPDEPEIIARLIEGLCQNDQIDDARRVLRAALFRNRRDTRFSRLQADFQFQQLHAEQCEALAERWEAPIRERPMLLPFVRPATGKSKRTAGGKKIRRDGPSRPAPHWPPIRAEKDLA
jgi:Tfp pilus assembly protein PilF